ncbi:glycosyltransferase family 2 protein [Neolewinella antarctica]|uniref:Glycosyltransferase involved in cell wall biosynthesis n=1 Tax=Neolewinella antarctica TaxID=442734 RepID=A0ABX0X767_9BACT|nr:glycosyltransferase family 2 protein [Neolewinella antarctica]NJC24982.1 glycosyltransferase involved in cell wall biosynthesis [Neolewinella antarctica]
MKKVSVVIITLNEAANLPRCLESVRAIADEVVVVDSLSTDSTVAIAEAAGARVIHQAFLGHREQKAFAIASATNELVLSIDADEALSPALLTSLRAVIADWTHDCYYMNRLNRFMGVWIHHGGWYPDRKMRLFDRRKYRLGGVNPHDSFDPVAGATNTLLSGDLLHYTDEGFHDRINRLNKHSTIAAQSFHDLGKRGSMLRLLTKPAGRFISEYFFQLGFLDGLPGYFIAKTDGQYVWMREAKLRALTKQHS